MRKDFIPSGLAEFRTYIARCHKKIVEKAADYKIPAAAIAPITLLFDAYIAADDGARSPETATQSMRDERRVARMTLEKAWRVFVNAWIRFNDSIGVSEKEFFNIMPRDTKCTPVKTPIDRALIAVRRLGVCMYEIRVVNEITGRRRLPEDAAGSYLYLLVSEPGVRPEAFGEYRKMTFSSTSIHILNFPTSQMHLQANVFACYANRHREEGPRGESEAFFII
jgi:hypothetical protein